MSENGQRKCAIPGCNVPLSVWKYYLCTDHYKEYGTLRPVPEWLRYLRNYSERERYFQAHHGWRYVSLEALTEKTVYKEEGFEADYCDNV